MVDFQLCKSSYKLRAVSFLLNFKVFNVNFLEQKLAILKLSLINDNKTNYYLKIKVKSSFVSEDMQQQSN